MIKTLALITLLFARMFTHLGVEDGLTQATVLCITEDSCHNVWMGTRSGLCRFDGYDVKTYKYELSDSTSVGANQISHLAAGADGKVFVCYQNGVSLYLPETDTFRRILDNGRFFSIVKACDGKILISFDNGLYCFHENGLPAYEIKDLPSSVKVLSCHDGKIWGINGNNRLCMIDSDCGKQTQSDDSPVVGDPFDALWVNDELWISSDYDGLFRFDRQGRFLRHYSRDDGLCSNYARPLCYDGNGHIWIGTGNNLSILDLNSGKFQTVSPDRSRKEMLSHASIKSLFKDSFGGIWIGTYYSGADYYHPSRDRFGYFSVTDDKSEDIIGAMFEKSDGRILVGTSRKGIYQFKASNKAVSRLPVFSIPSGEDAEKYDIKDIEYSTDGHTAYFGTALGGLVIYNETSGKARRLSGPKQIYSIARADKDHLWLGTESGVDCFDEKSCKTTPVVHALKNVMTMTIASDSTLWVGTFGHLYHFSMSFSDDGNPESALISEFALSTSATDIFESGEGKILVCTSTDGVLCPDESSHTLSRLDLGDNYHGSIICGIEEDVYKRLWISSESGLYCYNPESGFCRHFSTSDGLPSNVFTAASHLTCSDGKMLFGTIGYVVSFNPAEIKESAISPKSVIKSLEADGENLLSPGMQSVTLSHSQNSFRIAYSVCNPIAWRNSCFRYRMEGIDKKWKMANLGREVEFAHLPAGKYVFKVQSANDDGVWSAEPASLEIVIRPVWFLTTVAIIVEILLAMTALAFLFYTLLRRAGRRDRREIELLRKKVRENETRSFSSAFGKKNLTDEEYEFLMRANNIVLENIGNVQFNVNDFADKMNICRSGLHGHIKDITGSSALAFIKKIRFDYACRLLEEDKLSISEVSSKAGFASVTYFTTAFKNFMGKTPNEYRKANKNQ